MVSRYMNNITKEHLKAVHCILQYLKKSLSEGLYFKKSISLSEGLYFKKSIDWAIKVCTDVDWARLVTDRRSTTGYCSYVCGNLVTWRSKKQAVVGRSSVKAEFRAIFHGICE
ncbi:uncharacterized protein LOC111299809 [Durio zibethinus]|uniref:Uncharacterized protein LOC111299809 n=1 Tax=Durio zibethinus TaxID=66656 RepID=A0A6P5ZDY5_DURZI|nr:uncharacterized protein LOC111299809 [Durio zibethinus]